METRRLLEQFTRKLIYGGLQKVIALWVGPALKVNSENAVKLVCYVKLFTGSWPWVWLDKRCKRFGRNLTDLLDPVFDGLKFSCATWFKEGCCR